MKTKLNELKNEDLTTRLKIRAFFKNAKIEWADERVEKEFNDFLKKQKNCKQPHA